MTMGIHESVEQGDCDTGFAGYLQEWGRALTGALL